MADVDVPRQAMLYALAAHMGPEMVMTFDKMLPTDRWIETLGDSLRRYEVWSVVAEFEPQRRHLHSGLIDLIGAEHAGTLMEYLLPAPWYELRRLGVLPEAA